MLVSVPLILLLLDFWPLNRFIKLNMHSPETKKPDSRRILKVFLIEKWPFFLLSLIVGIITFFAQRSGGAVISLQSEGVSYRVATALTGYVSYLKKIAWPAQLTCLYLRPNHVDWLEVVLAGTFLVLVSILALLTLRRAPYLMVGWFWFVVMLLPVSGLAQSG